MASYKEGTPAVVAWIVRASQIQVDKLWLAKKNPNKKAKDLKDPEEGNKINGRKNYQILLAVDKNSSPAIYALDVCFKYE